MNGEQAERPTLDSAVDAAWAKLSGGDGDDAATTTEPGLETGTEPPQKEGGFSPPPEAPESSQTQAPAPGEASRTRDERGRYAKGSPATVQSATKQPTNGAKSTTSTTPAEVRELRPPPSFSPQAREVWASVPKEVQAEIWRRERETEHAVQTSASARQHAQWFQQTVGPYEQLFRAEGVDVRTGLGNLLQAMAVLHGPNPYSKAQLWTTVAKQYGIDPEMLNQAWNGTAQPGQQQPSPSVDPRAIAQQAAQYALGQMEDRRAQVVLDRAYQEVDSQSQQLEFFDDLRPMMSALMESAANVGQSMDIPGAYQLALSQRPDLQAILSQRERAAAATQQNQTVARARAAGSSIRGLPSPPPPPRERKAGLDGAVDAAWESVVRRNGIL